MAHLLKIPLQIKAHKKNLQVYESTSQQVYKSGGSGKKHRRARGPLIVSKKILLLSATQIISKGIQRDVLNPWLTFISPHAQPNSREFLVRINKYLH